MGRRRHSPGPTKEPPRLHNQKPRDPGAPEEPSAPTDKTRYGESEPHLMSGRCEQHETGTHLYPTVRCSAAGFSGAGGIVGLARDGLPTTAGAGFATGWPQGQLLGALV